MNMPIELGDNKRQEGRWRGIKARFITKFPLYVVSNLIIFFMLENYIVKACANRISQIQQINS